MRLENDSIYFNRPTEERGREGERGRRETTVQLSEIRSQNERKKKKKKKHHRNSSHRQRRNSSQVLSDGSENGEQSTTGLSKKFVRVP